MAGRSNHSPDPGQPGQASSEAPVAAGDASGPADEASGSVTEAAGRAAEAPANAPGSAAAASGPAAPAAPAAAHGAQLALYRRYRPATFAEVKGQEHVTEPLQQALRSGRVHHAYLFSGPRGCGKTTSARILARSLNCEQGPTPDPCGRCASCIALAPAGPGSIDVIEIDAASHGGVDDARDLRERAFYSPVAARYKIYIIDEAHMVTGGGFNALLKLVEEPPPHLKFVFATTEPEKVIPTIRSRTHHYPFRLVPPAVLRELLEGILRAEGVAYEPAVLPVVIRAAAGSARDSLSILDQLIAGAGEAGLRYDRAIALLGYTDDALLDEMAEALIARDGGGAFRAIDRVIEAGHDPRRFAADLLDRLRDLIILAAVPDAAAAGLLDVPEDRLEQMRKQAAAFGSERLVRAAEAISSGLVEMRGTTSPRLLLELMAAQVLLPAEPEPADLAARLERLESRLAGPGRAGAEFTESTTGAVRSQVSGPAVRSPDAGPAASRLAAPAPPAPRSAPPAPPAPRGSSPEPATPRGSSPEPIAPRGSSPEPPAPRDSPREPSVPRGSGPAPAAAAGSVGIPDAAALRTRWPDVLEQVRKVRKVAWILLSSASVESLQDNVLTLAFTREGDARGFTGSGCDSDLRNVLAAMFGSAPVIRTIAQPVVQGGGSAAHRQASDAQPHGTPADRGAPGGGPGIPDDPRPVTDAGPEDAPAREVLTGRDLIEQELGGQVIDDGEA